MTPDLQRVIGQLADQVIGDRVDAKLLRPVLIRSLTVEVQDFLKYHEVEGAEAAVRDHEILLQVPVARRTKTTKKENDQARAEVPKATSDVQATAPMDSGDPRTVGSG